MATLAEVKQAIDDQAAGTQALRAEVKKLKGDVVDQTAFAQLEQIVTGLDEKRQKLETEWLAELKEAKELAEEASLKAGRRGVGSDNEPNEEEIAHKKAFIDFARKRHDMSAYTEMREAEKKAVQTGTDSDGGFAVPTMISRNIQEKATEDSVIEDLVTTVQVGTSRYQELVDKGGMGYGWVGENDARPATGTPGLYNVTPPMGIVYAYPQASEVSLEDIFFDVEDWLVRNARTAFANARDTESINGNGADKPLGMLHTPPVADADGSRADKVYQFLASGVADGIGNGDELVTLVYKLKKKYRKRASWMMNDMSTAKVRVLKDSNDRFLWTDSLVVGEPDRLLGYAVNHVEAMPDIAANSTPISFGDYKSGYTMVKGFDLRVTKDEITAPGFVKWHIRQRLGGAPTNDDAVKFLKCAA